MVLQVSVNKLWASIARQLGAPVSMTNSSFALRTAYTRTLLHYEQASCASTKPSCASPSAPPLRAVLLQRSVSCM